VLTSLGFGPTAAASWEEKNRTASPSICPPPPSRPLRSIPSTALAVASSLSDSARESLVPAWTPPPPARRPPPTAGSRAPPTPAAQAPPAGTGSPSTRSPAAGKVRCSSLQLYGRAISTLGLDSDAIRRRFGLHHVSCPRSTEVD
jgi:hypothetical protein